MGLHHQLSASKADALRIELQGYFLKWSVRLDLHQHLPGYEPDALTVKLQTHETGRIPRCCPGLLLFPKQATAAGSLVSDERMDVRPGLAPGNVDLQTTGSTTSPCARIEMVPSAGSAPALLRSQRRMLLLHYEGSVEMDPPVGFAPTSSDLRNRCLSVSATEEFKNGAACRCRPDSPCLEDRHACCYINAAMKNGRWSW